ncbi:CocE/NonD family hydrolase [Dyella flagellata]|uniref:Glutaryl-7-ACA acylase n=1 Tax=Dyella flagellata TaxID=1867833 RepID=A0ABQ5X7D3_9GAMM|nr:CocE/NonD family hydrolase [Dyella flagellata]GLQ86584.1 glutaryl-7-ACA acylase [Dyella flagellata]
MQPIRTLFSLTALAMGLMAACAHAQTAPMTPDIPASFTAPTGANDYVKRVVMIPMRDGVKLHTVIVIPKGAHNAPILLTRTPYNADKRSERENAPHMLDLLPESDEEFVQAGYIRVFQDIRGKYGSEGPYVMTLPLRGSLNSGKVDESTDAYDTIGWLSKNLPESNGKVGMIGSSYEGFTVVMALVNPNPALKVAAPESPMVDGWMGDDWFHYGAYRQTNFDYITGQTTQRGMGYRIPREAYDDYTTFLRAGSAGDYARANGLDGLPFWRKIHENSAYTQFWSAQALDKVMAQQPLKVPTMWLQGLWDQEDMYGAIHSYEAMEPKDSSNTMNYLVMGPWFHSQVNVNGSTLGPLKWAGDTALQFRRDVLLPFFSQYLKDGAPKANTPPVLIYNTAENHWDRFTHWPLSCAHGCDSTSRPLYLLADGRVAFEAPKASDAKYDEYTSDPAKPVPYEPRPVVDTDRDAWRRWLLNDQRFVDDRPDVLTYVSAPLSSPLRVSGAPQVNLVASTSGTDSDWVVKVIDVYPDTVPSNPSMGGYELPISLDIFRGRYRTSFEHPHAIEANAPLAYSFRLPTVNHVFEPGHRIMVQVQSSLFPLYDRNPQTFVPNIFDAKPADYVKATQRVWHTPDHASFVSLPVVSSP